MKLRNRTPLPDGAVRRVLACAGRDAGALTAKVVVIVTLGEDGQVCATASRARSVWVRVRIRVRRRSKSRRGRRKTKRILEPRETRTDHGYIELLLPADRRSRDPLVLARAVYLVSRRAWARIRLFQDNGKAAKPKNGTGAANGTEAAVEAQEKACSEEAIRNLAMAIENAWRKHRARQRGIETGDGVGLRTGTL
jgi:hypothetical protein